MRYSLGLVKLENASDVIPVLSKRDLGVEIAMFDYDEVSKKSIQWFSALARQFSRTDLPLSIHAPIYDINPVSKDAFIRHYSERFLTMALELAVVSSAEVLVMHTGIPAGMPLGGDSYHRWLDAYTSFLEKLLSMLEGEFNPPKIALENTIERDPKVFEDIFSRVQSPYLGMCLDVAHALCYQKSQPYELVEKFKDRIIHFHISDNLGEEDVHLRVGEGKVNFEKFADSVKKNNLEDRIMVLELSLEDAEDSIEVLSDLF